MRTLANFFKRWYERLKLRLKGSKKVQSPTPIRPELPRSTLRKGNTSEQRSKRRSQEGPRCRCSWYNKFCKRHRVYVFEGRPDRELTHRKTPFNSQHKFI